jgi:hypothetical protein
VKHLAIATAVVLVATGAWWLLRGASSHQPGVLEPGDPLPMGETVDMGWVDEESGEVEVWKVTKRETSPEDRAPGPTLPEPDPDAADHRPDESTRALHAMGLEAWKQGEIPQAMDHFAQAIEQDPDDPLPRTQYGRLLVLAMDYENAVTHLKRAAELSPDDPQIWLDLATVYEKANVMDRTWASRRRAEELAAGREIRQDPVSGFWVVDGNHIYP